MNCGKCKHSFIDPNMKLMVCRRYPPAMTAFTKIYQATTAVLAEGQSQEEQMQTFFNFPVVNPDWSCGEFAAKGA